MITEQHSLLSGLSRTQAAALERRISSALTSAKILAYEVEHNNGSDNWFEGYANTLIRSIEGIKNLQLAPNAITNKVFPLEGNEKTIGLNILSITAYKKETLVAIKNKKPIITGPVNQGGTVIIGRAPVYLNRDTQKEVFWGFTSVLIDLDRLIESTQLKQLEEDSYQYQLSRINAETQKSIVISSSAAPITNIQASTDLIMPVDKWTITISKTITQQLTENRLTGYFLSISSALVFSIILYMILVQPQKLRRLVKEKTLELEELAYKDPLTDLPNRRYLQDNLPRILQNNKKNKRTSAFVYFDLDNFKRINDTIGHDVGDKILVIVAFRLNELKGVSDEIIRLGGDEFGVLFGDVESHEETVALMNKILVSIRLPIIIDNQEYTLTTSLGVAMIPEHGHDLLTVMQNADMALYQAKFEGKNRYAFYTESMKIDTYSQIQDEYDLTQAMQGGEFELYYQPQFNLKTNEVNGAEALIRWNHPEKGLVFPDNFIPLAESTGKIIELGYWILESGISYLKDRKEQGMPQIMLHINLSSEQLSDPNFVMLVQELLEKHDIPAEALGFEITETSLLEDVEAAKNVLQVFQDMGICIAIDDFGTGYSSLAQLKNLPVTLLKIDRSFIMDLEHDEDDRKIIEAIIAMAHKLNINVLAEGVETRKQWKMLESINCDFGQGYYVSKAVTVDEFNRGQPIVHKDT